MFPPGGRYFSQPSRCSHGKQEVWKQQQQDPIHNSTDFSDDRDDTDDRIAEMMQYSITLEATTPMWVTRLNNSQLKVDTTRLNQRALTEATDFPLPVAAPALLCIAAKSFLRPHITTLMTSVSLPLLLPLFLHFNPPLPSIKGFSFLELILYPAVG